MQTITSEQMREKVQLVAPSVFTMEKKSTLSDKYQQYPTVEVMDKLINRGWLPVKAQQQRVNGMGSGRQGFQKHILRFRNERDIRDFETKAVVGSEFFEIVLTNSHNGTSCYSISAGLFRLVCSNGLTVGNSAYGVTIRHMGSTPEEVVRASMGIAKQMPMLMGKVKEFRGVELCETETNEFARRAYDLKWDDKPVVKEVEDEYGNIKAVASTVFKPSELLVPRRLDDAKSDLWSVFNRIQENMMKGTKSLVETNNGWRKVRGIKSINEDLRINKSLWNLAEEYANN